MKRSWECMLKECQDGVESSKHTLPHLYSDSNGETSLNFPKSVRMFNVTHTVSEYSVLHESRFKTIMTCKINNVECVAKTVKQKEEVNSLLSLYLPIDSSEYCFSLKGNCLGGMFKGGFVDTVDVLCFVKDMLCILALLEKANITHNDIKPDNIVQYNNHWFLIDYELSKSFKLKNGKYYDTNNGQLRCERFSRGYRPPERIKSKLISPKSDMYSLGLVFLEVLFRKRLSGLEDPDQVQTYLQEIQSHTRLSNRREDKELMVVVDEILPCMLETSTKRKSPSFVIENLIVKDSKYSNEISNSLQFFQNIDHFMEKQFSMKLS